MAIAGLTQQEFSEKLTAHIMPGRAIDRPDILKGRDDVLRKIERGFHSPGRHFFVYGERGIGKTSLALTAAHMLHRGENDPAYLMCQPTTTMLALVNFLVKKVLSDSNSSQREVVREKLAVGAPGLVRWEKSSELQSNLIGDSDTINSAAEALRAISSPFKPNDIVVIIDEFDQIKDKEQKKLISLLMKNVSDQQINIRFIFCGIGESLGDLIEEHQSSTRYLIGLPLGPLTADALWEIMDDASDELGIEIHKEHKIRIGLISDGLPYYTHLICEDLFWDMFYDPEQCEVSKNKHFKNGVKGAVESAEFSWKNAYDVATKKYRDVYQEVLWAVADSRFFERQVSDVYQNSYLPIARFLKRVPLDKAKFSNRIRNLSKEPHGSILEHEPNGWYRFAQNMVRGYVRLRAEAAGVQLGPDHFCPPDGS